MDTTKNGLVFSWWAFLFLATHCCPTTLWNSQGFSMFFSFRRLQACTLSDFTMPQHSNHQTEDELNGFFWKYRASIVPSGRHGLCSRTRQRGGETVGFAPRCSKKTCWRRMNAMPAIFKTLSISATDWLTGNIKPFWQQMTWFHQQMFWV